MQKLKLNIEKLEVESFRVSEGTDAKGTVNARSAAQEEYTESEVSGCTCNTAGTAFFTVGCEYTVHWKAC